MIDRLLIARRPLNSTPCQVGVATLKMVLPLVTMTANTSIDPKILTMVGPIAHSAVVAVNHDGSYSLIEILSHGSNRVDNVTLKKVSQHPTYDVVEMNGFTWTLQKTGQVVRSDVSTTQIEHQMQKTIAEHGGYSPLLANCHLGTQSAIMFVGDLPTLAKSDQLPIPVPVPSSTEKSFGGQRPPGGVIYFAPSPTTIIHHEQHLLQLPNNPDIVHDLYTFMYLLKKDPHMQPKFSLDPNPITKRHDKHWYPDLLGETAIGQVMFLTDYQMKRDIMKQCQTTNSFSNPVDGTSASTCAYIVPECCADDIDQFTCTPDLDVHLRVVVWENYCQCMNPQSKLYQTYYINPKTYDEYTIQINQWTHTDPLWIRLVNGYRAFVMAKFLVEHSIQFLTEEEIEQYFQMTRINHGELSIEPWSISLHDGEVRGGCRLLPNDRVVVLSNHNLLPMKKLNVIVTEIYNVDLTPSLLTYYDDKLPFQLIVMTPSLSLTEIDQQLRNGNCHGTKNSFLMTHFFHQSTLRWFDHDNHQELSINDQIPDNSIIQVIITCDTDNDLTPQVIQGVDFPIELRPMVTECRQAVDLFYQLAREVLRNRSKETGITQSDLEQITNYEVDSPEIEYMIEVLKKKFPNDQHLQRLFQCYDHVKEGYDTTMHIVHQAMDHFFND